MDANCPCFVVVVPDRADYRYHSAMNGELTVVNITEETVMAGLSCGEVSYRGWKILDACVYDFLTIKDELIGPVMIELAEGTAGAKPIVTGESAVAGLSALMATENRPEQAQGLGLNVNSSVLVIDTEGATDPDIDRSIVGGASADIA
jgi:diaminopropionate ammonia-lyase